MGFLQCYGFGCLLSIYTVGPHGPAVGIQALLEADGRRWGDIWKRFDGVATMPWREALDPPSWAAELPAIQKKTHSKKQNWHTLATNTLVSKSGTDVPAAKIVSPITGTGIFRAKQTSEMTCVINKHKPGTNLSHLLPTKPSSMNRMQSRECS